jgi:hypothetical protein
MARCDWARTIVGVTALALSGAGAVAAQSKLPLSEGPARVEGGFLIIPGEVTNASGQWIRGVRIDVELFDASGRRIHQDRVHAQRDHIAPGEVSPFKFIRDVAKIKGTYAHHVLSVSAVPGPSTLSCVAEKIVVEREGLAYRIRGTLRSTGSEPCRNAQAVAAGYDASGRVYDVAGRYPDTGAGGLAPEESSPFHVLLENHSGNIVNVKAWGACSGR